MNELGGEDTKAYGYFSDGEDLSTAADVRCPNCGTSLLDLYKDGRMGCSECYVTFRSTVHRALIVLHGDHLHVGKSILQGSDY